MDIKYIIIIVIAVSVTSVIIYNYTYNKEHTYRIEPVITSGNSTIKLRIAHVYAYLEPIPSHALPPNITIRPGFSAPPEIVQRAYFKEIVGFKDIKFINGKKDDIYNNFRNLYEFVIEPGTKAYFTVVFDASDPIINRSVDNNGNSLIGLEDVVGSKDVTEDKLLKVLHLEMYSIEWSDDNIASINDTVAIVGMRNDSDINTVDGLNIDIDVKIVESDPVGSNIPYIAEITYTIDTDESVERDSYIYRVDTHYFGIITIGDKAYQG